MEKNSDDAFQWLQSKVPWLAQIKMQRSELDPGIFGNRITTIQRRKHKHCQEATEKSCMWIDESTELDCPKGP